VQLNTHLIDPMQKLWYERFQYCWQSIVVRPGEAGLEIIVEVVDVVLRLLDSWIICANLSYCTSLSWNLVVQYGTLIDKDVDCWVGMGGCWLCAYCTVFEFFPFPFSSVAQCTILTQASNSGSERALTDKKKKTVAATGS